MQGWFPAPDRYCFFEGSCIAGIDLKNQKYRLNEKLFSPNASVITIPRCFLIMTSVVIHTGIILTCREVLSRSPKTAACFHAPF
jgi:hypothetical protein